MELSMKTVQLVKMEHFQTTVRHVFHKETVQMSPFQLAKLLKKNLLQ